MKIVKLELTELEWEIINQALDAPIREYLLNRFEDLGIKVSEEEIMQAWDNVQEKFIVCSKGGSSNYKR